MSENISGICEKARYEFIDLAKGFCIILVVFHHLCGNYLDTDTRLYILMQSIRMPLYFILSGMFFSHYSGFIEFCVKKTNKLLIPFIFTFLVSIPVYIIRTTINGQEWWIESPRHFLSQSFVLNLPTWFLICLFIDGIIFYIISHIAKKSGRWEIITLVTVSLAIGITGYLLGIHYINLPLWSDTAMTALPFYAFGYILRKRTSFLQGGRIDKYLIPIFLFSMVFVYFFGQKARYVSNAMDGCSLPLVYLCGMIGTTGILCISKRIGQIKYISLYGRYSICILITHYIINIVLIVPILQCITERLSCSILFPSIIAFIILMCVYTRIIPIMIKYLGRFCAQKDSISLSDGKLFFNR